MSTATRPGPVPFTADDYVARMARVVDEATEVGLDGVIVAPGPDLTWQEAYGTPMTTLGQGGSIPLCNVFAETYPDAEQILMGVEEPLALIHAPNESVDPTEIEAMALTEALFLQRYAAVGS